MFKCKLTVMSHQDKDDMVPFKCKTKNVICIHYGDPDKSTITEIKFEFYLWATSSRNISVL